MNVGALLLVLMATLSGSALMSIKPPLKQTFLKRYMRRLVYEQTLQATSYN